jgi:glycosyltransferase involved in cell wall biosynthesis
MAAPYKLAVILSHPTQYYSPWFRWVAANTDIDLRVFYLWDFGVTAKRDSQFEKSFKWDVDLLSGYAHEFVPNNARRPGTDHFRGLDNSQLICRLAAWRPTALLMYGYKSKSHLRVLLWARVARIPVLFRGDSHFLGRGTPKPLTKLMLRTLYRQFSAFLAVGNANIDYFRTLGVPAHKLFRAPHSVDNSLFAPSSRRHQATAAELRTQFGLSPESRVVLFAGKFVPAKQPLELLDAFAQINVPKTALVFVGDGPEKAALESAARRAPQATIRFLPFANQTEMPARYLLAKVFALPSRGHYETWGLAVNEAMHMGVPALVSDLVGCQRDLVTDNVTGWVFNASAPATLASRLAEALSVCSDGAQYAALQARVNERIQNFTYAVTTRGLLEAIDFVSPKFRGED